MNSVFFALYMGQILKVTRFFSIKGVPIAKLLVVKCSYFCRQYFFDRKKVLET